MADTPTLEDYENGKLDLTSIGEMANGSATLNGTGIVTTRTAETYRTMKKIEADVQGDVDDLLTATTADLLAITVAAQGDRDDIGTLKTEATTDRGDIATLKTESTTDRGDIATLKTEATTDRDDIAALEADAEAWAAPVGINARNLIRTTQGLRKNNTKLALSAGKSAYTTGSNYTGFARGYLAGTDFAAGSFIDGVRAATQVPAAYQTAVVYERSPAASLTAVPGSAGDVIVAIGAATLEQYKAAGYCVPIERYPARNGYYYIPAMETYAADGVTRAAMGIQYTQGADGPTWQEGWVRVGSGAWAAGTNTRYLSVGLVTSAASEDATAKFEAARLARFSQQTAEYRQMVIRNIAQLRDDCAFDALGAGLRYRLSGDSLAQQTSGSPVRTSFAVLNTLSAGLTSINIGVSGYTTAQILAAINADNVTTPANAGGTNISNGSNNDENVVAYSVTRANTDAKIATFTGQWVDAVGGAEANGPTTKQQRLFKELRAVHGARIWDWETIWRQNEAAASDARLTHDGVHFFNLGTTLVGYEQTRLFRACNGGAPYVHEEVLPLRAGDAAGTVISDGLILGTPTQVYITAGDNSDNAVAVNASTGAITRGTGVPSVGSRQLIKRAQTYRGGHEGAKTFLMAQDTGDTMPRYDVEFLGTANQSPYLVPLDTANLTSSPVLANTTKISFVFFLRVTSGLSGGILGSGGILTTGTALQPRLFAKNTSAVALGGSPVFAMAPDPFSLNAYFGSYDTATGVLTYSTNEDSATVALTADSIPVDLSTFLYLFGSTGAPFKGGAFRRLMIFHGHAFDWTSAVKRALFYDPVTNLPINTGGATVDGQTAIIDMYGREYDWVRGINHGSLGNLLPARWNGIAKMGVRELS